MELLSKLVELLLIKKKWIMLYHKNIVSNNFLCYKIKLLRAAL